MFIFNLDRSRSSQRRNDPTHSLLFPQGTEIVRGINVESCGRKETYRAGENMLEWEMDGPRWWGGWKSEMDGEEWAEEVSKKSIVAQKWARGGAQVQMGGYFGKQTPDWPATETASSDLTHPDRK